MAAPEGMLSLQFDLEGRARPRVDAGCRKEESRAGAFSGMAETEPGSEGDTGGFAFRGIGKVEDDQAETARLDEQVCCFECIFGVTGAVDPEDAVEIRAGVGGGEWVEGAGGVNQGAAFAVLGGAGEQGEEDRGASTGGGSGDLSERTPGNAAGGEAVKGGDAGGELDLGAFDDADRQVKACGEGIAELRYQSHIRFLFAYYRIVAEGEANVKSGSKVVGRIPKRLGWLGFTQTAITGSLRIPGPHYRRKSPRPRF